MSEPRTTIEHFEDRLFEWARILTPVKKRFKTEFDYYANRQWPKKAEEELKTQDRAPVVFNQVFPVCNMVAGSENTNRYEGMLLPRTKDDEGFTDMMNRMIQYERDQVDAEFSESDSFLDCVICGVGITEFRRDYRQSIYGRTWVENVSPFDVLWDPNAKKRNMTDGRGIIQMIWMERDKAKERWPEHADKIDSLVGDYEHRSTTGNHYNAWIYEGSINWYDRDADEVLVHRYQYKDEVTVVAVADPETGQVQEYTKEEWTTLVSRLEELNEDIPTHVEVPRDSYHEAYILADELLSDQLLPVQEGFSLKFITGFRHRIEGRIEWFGLMRPMIDPQLWGNKMLSQLIYIVSTSPKGAMVAEEGVFQDTARARREWGKPNPLIIVRDGAIAENAIRIIEAKYPTAQDRIFQMAMEAVPRTVGLSAWNIGGQQNLSRTATGVVEMAQQGSLVRMSALFDSLKLYRKEATRQHLAYIHRFTPEGTIVRITVPGTSQTAAVPFKRQWVESFEFDVIISEQPQREDEMRALWESLMQTQALQYLVQMGLLDANSIAEMIPYVDAETRNQMKLNAAQQDAVGQLLQAFSQGDLATVQQILTQMTQQAGLLEEGEPQPEAAA